MADPNVASPSVALLGRDDAVRAQLRQALQELGADLVYEGELRGADPAVVTGSGARVVLLNLDAEGGDGLDRLDPLLLDPAIRVIFNEAETTASLSGWDLARWARHLAAKVLGHHQTIPPPPAGAEPLPSPGDVFPVPGAPPSPESLAAPLSMDSLRAEAHATLPAVPDLPVPAASAPATREDDSLYSEAEALAIDASDLAGALSPTDAAPPLQVARSSVPDAPEGGFDGDADITLQLEPLDEASSSPAASKAAAPQSADRSFDFELEPIEDAADSAVPKPAAPSAPAAAAPSDGLSAPGDDGGFMLDFDIAEDVGQSISGSLEDELQALADLPSPDDTDPLVFGDVAEDSAPVDFGIRLTSTSEDTGEEVELDDAVAALAAQLEAIDLPRRANADVPDPDALFSVDDRKKQVRDEPLPTVPVRAAGPSMLDASLESEETFDPMSRRTARVDAPSIDTSALSLEPLPDPGLLVAPTRPKKPEEEPYLPRPGIDLVLAPKDDTPLEGGDAAPTPPAFKAVKADIGEGYDLSGLALEPLEGELDEELPAKPAPNIPRVLVLGASIGGPDALRIFLAGLPAGFPALIVLAQHLESGFFDRLAQQLQKISRLPVRVAAGATRVAAGEVLVVPSGERVLVEPDGAVHLQPYAVAPHYRPCIDDVMRDIADRFGTHATAIIFSGMAGDAVEGAVYLTSKGGEVWVQDPASCVVSSMVDGAQARGVVEFVGTPRELAERCVARFGRNS